MASLGNLNPKYFYIEKGEIKKYVYCQLCHAGPFKKNEDMDNFIFFGVGNREPYCMACAKTHNYFKPLPRRKKPDIKLKSKPESYAELD